MGDRINMRVIQEKYEDNPNEVWLYCHWTGMDLLQKVQNALAKKQRWGDDSYLTRILFCTVIGDRWEDETGFGISTYYRYPNHDDVVVNIPEETVSFGEKSWSFEEFIELDCNAFVEGYYESA